MQAPTGALLSDVISRAGLELDMPCGGQGRCGRCAVIAKNSRGIRRRSTLRLNPVDLEAGYALACQTVIEGDAVVVLLPPEKIERHLSTDKTAAKVTLPFNYVARSMQPVRAFVLTIDPPDMADQTDDWSRLKRALAAQHEVTELSADLPVLRQIGPTLRQQHWHVTAVVEMDMWSNPGGPPRLIDLLPVAAPSDGVVWGAAVDIGTTTVSLYLVNLVSGEILTKTAEYNDQIKRGEDVISRIIYAGKNHGLQELQALVVETINKLADVAARRAKIDPACIFKMTVTGNSTMLHLLLGLPPASIRLEPFVTAVNQPPPVRAGTLGLNIHPQATVDCLPGVASYVGADITAGVVGSQMCDSRELTLFLDVGTNGEMVLGDGDWLMCCACSAGPAFEGAGVQDGMRATFGAIEEVWINPSTFEPTCRVIAHPKFERQHKPTPPRGICGSGLISLLAELFITGIVDKRGNLNLALDTARVRQGAHGAEYVVTWAGETAHGRDIVITKVDIDNLMRAKGAIFAGISVLAESVGVDPAAIERVLIGGSFGQYINVEKAVQIGLLPDMPWDKFHFLGNTSLRGSLLALLSRDYRRHIEEAAAKMTYLELSADNAFYHQFTSALFLPHTNIELFPSVAAELAQTQLQPAMP